MANWHRPVARCLQTSCGLSWTVDVGCDYRTKVTLAMYVEVVLLFFEAA